MEGKLTGGLLAKTLANLALVLEVNVPLVGLAGGVLEDESKDGVALLDGVLAVSVAAGKGAVNGVESGGGRELVYIVTRSQSALIRVEEHTDKPLRPSQRAQHGRKECERGFGLGVKDILFLRDILVDLGG